MEINSLESDNLSSSEAAGTGVSAETELNSFKSPGVDSNPNNTRINPAINILSNKIEVGELLGENLQFEPAVLSENLQSSRVNNPPSSQFPAELKQFSTKAIVSTLLFRPNQNPVFFEPEDLSELVTYDENFLWLDISNYTEPDLRSIGKELKLHPIALKAALGEWQRPRFDTYRDGKHYLVTVTIAHVNPSDRQVLATELDLFVGNNFLVSVHKSPLPFGNKITERAKQSPELVKLDSNFMLYLILDELLEYYEELSDHIEVETAGMELLALKKSSDTFLGELVQLKQYIFALTRLVDQHRKVFASFVRPDNLLTNSAEMSPYFQDLETHFERLLDTLQPAQVAVNGAFDIYVSHMSHKTNQVIKALTILSTVILPASVIISLFGSNIVGLSQSGLLDFIIMLVIIFVTSAALLSLFRRIGWI